MPSLANPESPALSKYKLRQAKANARKQVKKEEKKIDRIPRISQSDGRLSLHQTDSLSQQVKDLHKILNQNPAMSDPLQSSSQAWARPMPQQPRQAAWPGVPQPSPTNRNPGVLQASLFKILIGVGVPEISAKMLSTRLSKMQLNSADGVGLKGLLQWLHQRLPPGLAGEGSINPIADQIMGAIQRWKGGQL
jgi:hypothetical protein